MNIGRRKLLATGAAGLSAGLAGCPTGPIDSISVTVSVEESFATEEPIEVPVTVRIAVQNVGREDVGIRGLELHCYGADLTPLATEQLGDFFRSGAEAEQRESEESDSLFGSTRYRAEWTIERTVSVDAVPEWLTFRFDEAWFQADSDEDPPSSSGTVQASGPPNETTFASISRYSGDRPPASTVSPAAFEYYRTDHRTRSGTGLDEPVLPDPVPLRTVLWYDRGERHDEHLTWAAKAFGADGPHTVTVQMVPELDADHEYARPHLIAVPHTELGRIEERDGLYDATGGLDITPEDRFVWKAVDASTREGQLVGLPYGLRTVALLYNRDRIEEPPETIEELTTLAEHHHDPATSEYGLTYPLSPFSYSGWARIFGGSIVSHADGEVADLTAPETVRGIELFVDELLSYVPEPHTLRRQADVFSSGAAPLAIGGPRFLMQAVRSGIDVGVASLPTTGGWRPSPYISVQVLGFTGRLSDARPDAAVSFAERYATRSLTLDGGGWPDLVPAATSILDADHPAATDEFDPEQIPVTAEGFRTSIRSGRLEPMTDRTEIVYPALQTAVESAIGGEHSVETALATAQAEIDAETHDN